MPNWTNLPNRQLVTFFDPLNPGTKISPQINPQQIILKPSNVRKYVATTNGTSIILGDREYPPKEISLTWPMLDAADYDAIRQFVFINPIVFVDNNNQGYLGVLIIDDAEQLAHKSKLVYQVRASFLVLAPYSGINSTLTQVPAPALTLTTNSTTGGYIPASTTQYFWSTVFTPYGESLVSSTLTCASGSGTSTNYFGITWTAPTSNWYRKVRLYWNSSNNPLTATMLTEVLAGQTSSFTAYGPYFAYSTINPPAYGMAFGGYFAGAKFVSQP